MKVDSKERDRGREIDKPNSPGSIENVEFTIAGLLFHRKNERYSTFLTLRLIYSKFVLKN